MCHIAAGLRAHIDELARRNHLLWALSLERPKPSPSATIAMVGARIARFLIWNIAAALRSKVMWLIAENHAGSIPRRSCFIFGCACERNLVQDVHRLVCSAGQERSRDRPPEAKCASPTATSGLILIWLFSPQRAPCALGVFVDTNLEAEKLLLPFSRRRFHHPITRARTWNRVDARV